jgi:hypothetical protein
MIYGNKEDDDDDDDKTYSLKAEAVDSFTALLLM